MKLRNSLFTIVTAAGFLAGSVGVLHAQDDAAAKDKTAEAKAKAPKDKKKAGKAKTNAAKFVSLFDGKSLNGWKANEENPSSFSIEDGAIKVNGERGHLFYVGDVNGGKFKNFVLKAKVMTKKNANSGLYFHTAYQKEGWPDKGYEVQVNNTHSDWRKTGSLYAVDDVKEAQKDDTWMNYTVRVQGNHVTIRVNGKKVVDYTQPEKPAHLEQMPGRLISEGTFAIQAHDPGSTAYFKDIQVRVLD
ncbi:MAG: DUF1080 domain-containing protein [Verrucomicrobiae bacterium]|nr:DUF1080 domain-containing protein [Verrucomicrobiae bacterium]